ncbi:hypothetical protein [Novosphingobium terrae]|uniref:hypothetical protein n=1 Tax=Novosphingobium terrae TaxID=2726189 RepID=UPI00197F7199|nr:hypothetical protein [Novosphingobium terrae]
MTARSTRRLVQTMLLPVMLCAAAHHADAQTNAKAAPAQALVDEVVAENPELLDVLLHVTPPGESRNIVIAAHLPKDLGEVSGEDDLGVARTGKPLVEVQKDGVRIGVLLQLRDAQHRPIGAVGIMSRWKQGDSQKAALARAIDIRDLMAQRITALPALFTAPR